MTHRGSKLRFFDFFINRMQIPDRWSSIMEFLDYALIGTKALGANDLGKSSSKLSMH
jgi:hypothetical protein